MLLYACLNPLYASHWSCVLFERLKLREKKTNDQKLRYQGISWADWFSIFWNSLRGNCNQRLVDPRVTETIVCSVEQGRNMQKWMISVQEHKLIIYNSDNWSDKRRCVVLLGILKNEEIFQANLFSISVCGLDASYFGKNRPWLSFFSLFSFDLFQNSKFLKKIQ